MTVLRVSYWEISMAQVQQGPSPIFTFLHTQFPLAKQFFFYNWATAQQKNTPESDKWLGANLALAYWAGQSRLPEVATKVATWMSFHCSAAAPVWEACRSEVRTSCWGIALNFSVSKATKHSRKNPPHPHISPSLQYSAPWVMMGGLCDWFNKSCGWTHYWTSSTQSGWARLDWRVGASYTPFPPALIGWVPSYPLVLWMRD